MSPWKLRLWASIPGCQGWWGAKRGQGRRTSCPVLGQTSRQTGLGSGVLSTLVPPAPPQQFAPVLPLFLLWVGLPSPLSATLAPQPLPQAWPAEALVVDIWQQKHPPSLPGVAISYSQVPGSWSICLVFFLPPASSAAVGSGPPPEAEQAWPQSSGEEELQLQLALAMSKEEADQPPSCGPEDDVQLQLALSLSREEHDKEERIRRGDDLRLQMAIEESKRETGGKEESSLMDLADVFTAPAPPPASDPWGGPAPMAGPIPTAAPASDPWGGPVVPPAADPWGGPAPTPASGDPWRPAAPAGPSVDPWGGTPAPAAGEGPMPDPWGSSDGGAPVSGHPASDPWAPAPAFSDPWGGSPAKPSTNGTAAAGGFDPEPDEFSDFDRLRTVLPASGSSTGELELLAGEVPARSPGAFDMSGVGGSLAEAVGSSPPATAPTPTPPTRKTPESFLGPNAALVDLDSLVSRPGPTPPGAKASNPFLPSGAPATGPSVTNPFQPAPPATLTLNQLRLSPVPPAPGAPPTYISPLGGGPGLPPMMPPGPPAPNTNPFLL
uniref:Epsin 1 n=1 Tax=Marmota marmota marmota TaxID=9994 RepID=A0A8C5YKL7_MARMA